MLNKTKGNMYEWLTHTWNTVKGECPHNCAYCYMKRWGEQKPVRFDETELKTDLGSGNFIFVGSSCDMFANEIPNKWIRETLHRCEMFDNKYLFQSKNPARFIEMKPHIPKGAVLGTTIESDVMLKEMGNTPHVMDRARALWTLGQEGFKTMVTIEPVINFNVIRLFNLIAISHPNWVNIGANTNSKTKLPEPSPEKINELIKRLRDITEVKVKSNLKRLGS